MRIVTTEQMRDMDRRAVRDFGIPGVVLMENAGRAVVDVIAREYGSLQGMRVAVFCGSGNNGGDGFVAARYLLLAGARPTVFLADSSERINGDARIHYNVLMQIDPTLVDEGLLGVLDDLGLDDAGGEGEPEGFADDYMRHLAAGCDLVIDALLGTGLKSAPSLPYARLINAINRAGTQIVAIDVPSGIDVDTGAIPGAAIKATHTVTFAYPKLGQFLFPGAGCVGRLHLSDIGFDWERLAQETGYRLYSFPAGAPRCQAIDGGGRLPRLRSLDANKGEFGHVGVLAGSLGMAGAPALTARAAQRSGIGLVTVLAPACAQPLIAAKLDEQLTLALPDEDGAVAEAAFDAVKEFAEKATVLCIGPGLTVKHGAAALVQRALAELKIPIVLDADGLNILAQHPDCVKERPRDPAAPLVLTPHPGEAARLMGISIAEVQSDRVSAVRELARRFRAVVLLKGRYTLISSPSGEVVVNTTGNPGMATGGSGDTLTGIIGSLLAQGFAYQSKQQQDDSSSAEEVDVAGIVALAVYLHGLAGDCAAAQIGEIGLMAGDIVAHLPNAIRQLEEPG